MYPLNCSNFLCFQPISIIFDFLEGLGVSFSFGNFGLMMLQLILLVMLLTIYYHNEYYPLDRNHPKPVSGFGLNPAKFQSNITFVVLNILI